MRQKGFTLVEVMIALLLGLLVIAGVLGLFLSSSRNYGQDQKVAALQDEMRYAITQLTQDVEMAGFWGQTASSNSIISTPTPTVTCSSGETDCAAARTEACFYDDLRPLSFADNVADGSSFPCFQGNEVPVRNGTDILSIKRVAGLNAVQEGISQLEPGKTYISTAQAQLEFLVASAAPSSTLAASNFWRYQTAIYYIGDVSVTDATGNVTIVPSLCREQLTSSATSSAECIASGVEDFQIEFGIDTDGNGKPNFFLATPSDTQLAEATQVRLNLLIRSSTPDGGYTNAKTYFIGNKPAYTPSDNFYRRVISSVVILRNPLATRILNS